ncbi:MAG: M1 family aminopeptidase [Leadbetterella sp.]
MKRLLFLSTLIFSVHSLLAQRDEHPCAISKREFYSRINSNAKVAYPGDQNIDVTFHKLDVKIDVGTKGISGTVATDFLPLSDITTCFFDLNNALAVSSVKFLGQKITYTHAQNKITITFPSTLKKGVKANVEIEYAGIPRSTGYGTFNFDTHGSPAVPVFWTLSEPYGSADWWPCKDDLSDKPDSSVVAITMDKQFYSVSNGLLQSEKSNADNTKTFTWKNSYPIAHYLISIASSNYNVYNSSWTYKGKTMPINHYIFPESLTSTVRNQLDVTNEMLTFFSDLFGEYPFIKERYGHKQCKFGGGMEHQTVSSMGSFVEFLVAHELAHQWFGDKITCGTWKDIFINEAFASYSELLWDEHKYGSTTYNQGVVSEMNQARGVKEPIYISNPTSINAIFNGSLTYSKGAVILHMLRGAIGKEDFNKCLKAFMSSEFAYKFATIEDFRKVVEKTTGKNHKVFFDQWVYGVGNPSYSYKWSSIGKAEIEIVINQKANTNTKTGIFKMPVQMLVKMANGKDSLVTMQSDTLENSMMFKGFKSEPVEVVFDPNNLILKEPVTFLGKFDTKVLSTSPIRPKLLVYPNPVDDYLYVNSENYCFTILNESGKEIQNGEVSQEGPISVSNLPSGVYLIVVDDKVEVKTLRFVKN